MKIDAKEVLKIAKAVARRYASRCWWADVDDLTQTASVAVLEATKTWDPQVGHPFSGYAARAASNVVRDSLWEQSSPVTGGKSAPRTNMTATRGEVREEPHMQGLDDPRHIGDIAVKVMSVWPDPGKEIDDIRWKLAVRRRLRRIANSTKNGELALEVLVRGKSSGEVIKETGRDVYHVVHLVRRKVRTDAVMHKLLARRAR